LEHSLDWETALKQTVGVIPPRTHISPFIAKPHPALKDREIPLYTSSALLSQIVPGGKLDPYANPYPTPEQFAKENARLLALPGHKQTKETITPSKEDAAEMAAYFKEREDKHNYHYREMYRSAPAAEYYRVLAYAKLHPELTIDEAKFKLLDIEKLKYQY
jgi:hypothetical protein